VLTRAEEPSKETLLGKVKEILEMVLATGPSHDDPDDEATEKEDHPVTKHPDPTPEPTPAELESFTKVVARLWSIDDPYRLFSKVNGEKFLSNPTSKAFISLLDNYEREDSIAEKVTDKENMEMDNFLRRLMKTPHMQYIHKVLVKWGKADPLPRKFAAKIFEIWFSCYSMHGPRGPKTSSGFEHVFVGEEKNKNGHSEIIGFHNWVQFWKEEKAKRVNYRGYVGTLDSDDKRVVSVRFDWADDDPEQESKNVSTFVVGTSIAFEFAMLTCAFLGFDGDSHTGGIWLGDVGPMSIRTYKWDTPLGTVIRSAYVES